MLETHALVAILLTLAALVLFSREKIPLEHSSLGVLVALVLIFELFPIADPGGLRGTSFLRGFGNDALITICLLLILAKGIVVSGALQPVGRLLTKMWLGNRLLALLFTLLIAAFISAFANNTPIVVMMLPILVGVAHRADMAPSKMLMPVGFATIIGGMSTTIGTSSNLLIVSVSEANGLPRLEMFDFTLPAAIAAGVGILYLWLLAPRLLPTLPSLLAGTAPRVFHASFELQEESPYVGETLATMMRDLGENVRLERIERGSSLEVVRLPTLTLQAGDRLHFRGTPEEIHAIQVSFEGDAQSGRLARVPEERLVEVVITPDSPLHNKTLAQAQAGPLRGLHPIGWYRPGQNRTRTMDRASDTRLWSGDVLLMQGPRQQIQELMDTPRILILARSIHLPRSDRAPIAIAIMVAVILVAALGLLPILTSALIGVGLMLASRCLDWDEAWDAVDTRLALVVVTSLALGTALSGTGAASFLASSLAGMISGWPPPLVISSLLLMTALLTEVVTNNAVAVIATPIAMSIANELGLPALPFVLAVLFGANMSYLTPIGYQTNLLVMSAGGYRFKDFFRAGLPLQILLWLSLSVILPVMYL